MTSSVFKLWPGVADLMKYGRWSHFVVAVLFAFAVDFYIFFNYYWVDYFSFASRKWQLAGLAVFWLFLTIVSSQATRGLERRQKEDANGDLFSEATTQYLKGNWFETECCLKSLLRKNPEDVEAILLLATLFRHTKRFDEAGETLTRLEKLENSDRWFYEILLEKKELKAARNGDGD